MWYVVEHNKYGKEAKFSGFNTMDEAAAWVVETKMPDFDDFITKIEIVREVS